MIQNSLQNNADPIIEPLLEENFWTLTNISLELDYCSGLISSGSIDIKEYTIETTSKLIKFLVLSIVKGEYTLKDTLDYLKEFSQKLHTIRKNSYYFEQDNLAFDNKFFQDNFFLPLNYCVTSYISLIVHLNNIYNLENIDYLFEYNSDDENNTYNGTKAEEDIIKWITLFRFNIITVRIENQFNVEEQSYRTLLNISSDLNTNDYDTIFKNILKQKCDFLRYKWVIRRKKSGNTVKYLKDGTFIEPQFEGSTNAFILKWKDDIDTHYSDSSSSEERFKTIYNNLKRRSLNTLSLYELHQVIKYSKDFKKDYNILCEYVEEIKKRESSLNNSDYNKYIFAKDYNYALNNRFSLLISSKKHKIEEKNSLYEYIKDFQEKYEIKNFFVNYKYLEFLVNEIKNIDNKSTEIYLEKTHNLFSLGENIIDNYKSDIEWSQKNLIFLYYFEFEKSLVKINDIDVFLQSNFQLPLSPTKYLKEFTEVKKEFRKLKGQYDVFEKINPQVEKVKELEKKDIRDLERLSLFSAVISFIISGAVSFTNMKDVYTLLMFFIIFSASLTSFLIILFGFTRGKEIFKTWKIIIITLVLYIFFGVSMFFIRKLSNDDYSNKIEKLEKKIESFNNNKKISTPHQQGGKTNSKTNGT